VIDLRRLRTLYSHSTYTHIPWLEYMHICQIQTAATAGCLQVSTLLESSHACVICLNLTGVYIYLSQRRTWLLVRHAYPFVNKTCLIWSRPADGAIDDCHKVNSTRRLSGHWFITTAHKQKITSSACFSSSATLQMYVFRVKDTR
jgi:hypothetical protein